MFTYVTRVMYNALCAPFVHASALNAFLKKDR